MHTMIQIILILAFAHTAVASVPLSRMAEESMQKIVYSPDTEKVEPVRASLAPEEATIREVREGRVVGGIGNHGVLEWRGLPYAKPPVGQLRWRAPRDPDEWIGVRDATSFQSRCVQYPNNYWGSDVSKLLGSEDCLYLNIFSPPKIEKSSPVMVWFHGGNNIWGHGGQHDAAKLAVSQDVVVVTFNYRLGLLGAFSHPANRETAVSTYDDSPNFHLLDAIQALRWVKNNISVFGGDPNNITIFGESAGGHNIYSLLVTPAASDLFHKAIIQSGYVGSISIQNIEQGGATYQGKPVVSSADRFKDLAKSLSKDMRKHMSTSLKAKRDIFENLSVEQLYRGLQKKGPYIPVLIADDVLISCSSMMSALKDPKCHNSVPVIAGSNRDESKLFLLGNPYFIKWSSRSNHHKLFHPRVHAALARYQSLQWELFSVDDPLRSLRKAGNSQLFAYRFDWDELRTGENYNYGEILGAAHALDVPFVFGNFDDFMPELNLFPESSKSSRQKLSNAMMSYWAHFAWYGEPGKGKENRLPQWHQIDSVPFVEKDNHAGYLVLDSVGDGGIKMASRKYSVKRIAYELMNDQRLKNRNVRCGVIDATISHYPRPMVDGQKLIPLSCN